MTIVCPTRYLVILLCFQGVHHVADVIALPDMTPAELARPDLCWMTLKAKDLSGVEA